MSRPSAYLARRKAWPAKIENRQVFCADKATVALLSMSRIAVSVSFCGSAGGTFDSIPGEACRWMMTYLFTIAAVATV
ncbi:hypothetical protein BH09ACT6_BH09ACT6_15010 [soil metagenome]